ncbi:MAG TPA: NUDIX domain-containing protein [Motilibacteraceae bacterium]|nr:NUDIX domain-containing protein [Motilibacteraceae bacterium]
MSEAAAPEPPEPSEDPLHADAVAVLQGWAAPDAEGERLRADYLGFLGEHPDGMRRSCLPEHLTASALVVDAAGERALLTLHAKGGFWVQTGGHCEPQDRTLAVAALREATEESGIEGLTVLPGPVDGLVDLDRHRLSGSFGTCRAHWDVRYVVVAPPGAVERRSEESTRLGWFDLAAMAEGRLHPEPAAGSAVVDLGRLARAARTALAPRA